MSKGTEAGKDWVGPGNQESLCNYSARWVGSDVGDKLGKIGCQGMGVGGLEWHAEKLTYLTWALIPLKCVN